MPYYIVNNNPDDKGRHEVHTNTCAYLPSKANQIDAGYHSDCAAAIKSLKLNNPYHEFDGCWYCSRACNRG